MQFTLTSRTVLAPLGMLLARVDITQQKDRLQHKESIASERHDEQGRSEQGNRLQDNQTHH